MLCVCDSCIMYGLSYIDGVVLCGDHISMGVM